jgi:hypothetical protein
MHFTCLQVLPMLEQGWWILSAFPHPASQTRADFLSSSSCLGLLGLVNFLGKESRMFLASVLSWLSVSGARLFLAKSGKSGVFSFCFWFFGGTGV